MSSKIDHSSRAHALLSASSSARWLACPPSAVAAAAYPNQDTAFTREGTLAHQVAEFMMNFDTSPSNRADWLADFQNWMGTEDVTQEMLECAESYRDYVHELQRTDDAVVMLERRVDFSPWVPGGFGSADCIIIQGTHMDVIDYKYGQGVSVSAVENPQMMLYGLGALNDYGFIYDVHTVGLHIFQPRMNNVSDWELSASDLAGWGDDLVMPVAELAAKGDGAMAAGEHCRFCPHAGRCPELARSCAIIVETADGPVDIPALAPWQIADILAAESKVTAWLKAVKERALSGMLNGEEIPGYKVVAGKSSRSWADDLEVAALLEGAGYSRAEFTKTEVLSPYNMEKALGKKKVAELLSDQIRTVSGSPTVAPESDKRKPYDRTAELIKDFG